MPPVDIKEEPQREEDEPRRFRVVVDGWYRARATISPHRPQMITVVGSGPRTAPVDTIREAVQAYLRSTD